MKKSRIFYLGLFIQAFLITAVLCSCASRPFRRVGIKDVYVRAEVADSDIKRQQGLMFRRKIAENQGMLFIFEEEGLHSFWMKNMRFPLDIVWIGSNGRIVDIYQNALPCKDICRSITPVTEAKFVLEVKAGFVERNNIKIGDKLKFLTPRP